MSGGFEWHENDGVLPPNAEYNGWVLSADPVAYLLARPLVSAPGTTFTYNTAGTHLLSVMLTGALDKPLTDFARAEVFTPLGIGRASWEIFPRRDAQRRLGNQAPAARLRQDRRALAPGR